MPDAASKSLLPGEPKHQLELDGIRGIAILLVLASHAAGLLGVLPGDNTPSIAGPLIQALLIPGWGGVDLFFVLSGFLITGILLRTKTRPHYFQSFYARRVLRIFPIYYLALVASLVVANFFPAVQELLPPQRIGRVSYFLYLQNVPAFWTERTGIGGLWGVYWSLAVEEQFYTVWPLLVRRLTNKVMLTVCVVCFALELPLRLLLTHYYFGMHLGAIQFTPDRADGLFVGAAIALYMHMKQRTVPMPWIKLAGAIGIGILLYVLFFHPGEVRGDGILYTIGVTAFALLSGALVAWSQHHPRWLQRVLSWTVLRQAGKYSYGMYVYHLFLYFAVRHWMVQIEPEFDGELKVMPALGVMAASMLGCWIIAKLSYDLIEKRFLALKRYFPAST